MSLISFYKKTRDLEAKVKREKKQHNLIIHDLFCAYKTGKFQCDIRGKENIYLKQIYLWESNMGPRKQQYLVLPEEYLDLRKWGKIERILYKSMELQLPLHPGVTKAKVNAAIKYLGYDMVIGNHYIGGYVTFLTLNDVETEDSPNLKFDQVYVLQITRYSIEEYVSLLKKLIVQEKERRVREKATGRLLLQRSC